MILHSPYNKEYYLEVPSAVLSNSVTYDVGESIFFGSMVSVNKILVSFKVITLIENLFYIYIQINISYLINDE